MITHFRTLTSEKAHAIISQVISQTMVEFAKQVDEANEDPTLELQAAEYVKMVFHEGERLVFIDHHNRPMMFRIEVRQV
jgi:hypothetical protein